jgi:type IV pilus biogenesis protein CpaD/CtpE
MLAEPTDLDRGRPLGPADGTHAAAAVDAYRTGKVKASSGVGSFAPGSSAASGS